jgi:hypothetical protein
VRAYEHEEAPSSQACTAAAHGPASQAAARPSRARAAAADANANATAGNALDILRTRLHLFGRWFPDTIDAHYTAFSQQAFDTNCVETLMAPGAGHGG